MTLEGQQLDRYHIVRLLGSGGMGDVYLAQDLRIGQQVAIKVIRMETGLNLEQSGEATRLFQREAKAIVALDHPHILSLFDYGEERIGDSNVIYLVMPYRPEGSLTQWLRQHTTNGLLSPQDVAHLIQQAADALQHAHDHQIIHQDVKPSNFLLRERKETPTRPDLLLADFSIARLNTATSSVSQSVRGTPTYMAPEQWQGMPVFATDQYALAVMAYELLTGHPPFKGSPAQMMYHHLMGQPVPASQVNPRLPKAVDAVLLRGLAKRPEDRFPSITAFAHALYQAVQPPTAEGELRAVLAISPEEARSGTTRTITLPGGRSLPVTVPPEVQNGHVIYLAGEGEISHENGKRGNLFLTVMITQESKPGDAAESAGAIEPTARSGSVEIEDNAPVLPLPTPTPERGSGAGMMQVHSHYDIQQTPSMFAGDTLASTPPPFHGETWGSGASNVSYSSSVIPPPPPGYIVNTGGGYNQTQPDQGRQRLVRIALSLSIAILLILSAVIGIGAFQDSRAINNLQATRTAQNNHATGTAAAQVQATNQAATATANAEAYASYLPGRGTPALFDTLQQPGNWNNEKSQKGTGVCQFTDGAYHIRETALNTFFYCPGALSLSDFAFEVQMTIIQGDCGGIMFREDDVNGKFYYFRLCRAGTIELINYRDFTGKNTASLVSSRTHAAIKSGINQTNLLAVVARGSEITLFVNRQQVATVQDKSYPYGSIALFASAPTNPTEVVFKDVKVWTL